MSVNIIKIIVATILISLSSLSYADGRGSVIVKSGSFTLAEKNQTIVGAVTFDETSASPFAIEYEYKMRENLSWGGEYISYTNTYSSGAGKASFTHIMFNIRKLFKIAKHVEPFVGIGAGAATVALSGIGSGTGGGFGFQLMGGVKFPFNDFSAVIEYKMITANPDDKAGTSVNSSGSGLFAGIGITF